MKYLALILLLICPALAQDKHPIDVQFDKNSSTHEMVAADENALKSWDKALNKHYQKLMPGLDAAGKANLKDSQRA